MTNPLRRQAAAVFDRPYRTPQEHVDWLNATCTRPDIEWLLGENGAFHRDKQSWTARRTRELETKAEQSRTQWKRAQARSE